MYNLKSIGITGSVGVRIDFFLDQDKDSVVTEYEAEREDREKMHLYSRHITRGQASERSNVLGAIMGA